MDDFEIEQILEVMYLLPYLCPYYRFSAYHEYTKFKCVCSRGECCDPVNSELQLFCKGRRLSVKTISTLKRCELLIGEATKKLNMLYLFTGTFN